MSRHSHDGAAQAALVLFRPARARPGRRVRTERTRTVGEAMFRIAGFLLVIALALAARPAECADLTTLDATATIQSVIFTQGDPRSPGTTVYQAFLRVQATGVEQGFNTDFRPLEPDAIGTLITRSLPLNSLQRVLLTTPQGSDYYFEFHLDANESTGGNSFLSIDQIRFYTAAEGNIATSSALNMTGVLRYDMDQAGEQTLLLDTALEVGSGNVDLTIHVPTWYFSGSLDSDYLYLYFRAGDQGLVGVRNYASSGGYEEVLALQGPASSVGIPSAAAHPWIRVLGGGEGARFRCSVPGAGRVDIGLYDVQGRQVSRYERETVGASVFETSLYGGPRRAASGIYFYRFGWNGTTRSTGKLTLLR